MVNIGDEAKTYSPVRSTFCKVDDLQNIKINLYSIKL
jgi:hypothetical protein